MQPTITHPSAHMHCTYRSQSSSFALHGFVHQRHARLQGVSSSSNAPHAPKPFFMYLVGLAQARGAHWDALLACFHHADQ